MKRMGLVTALAAALLISLVLLSGFSSEYTDTQIIVSYMLICTVLICLTSASKW